MVTNEASDGAQVDGARSELAKLEGVYEDADRSAERGSAKDIVRSGVRQGVRKVSSRPKVEKSPKARQVYLSRTSS